MPAKATDTFTFVSGGDCGTNPHAIANNILAAKQEPHFALIGGDLAYDNGRSAGTRLQVLPQLRQAHDRPARAGYSARGVHRQPRGRRRLQGQARDDATFFMPLFDGLYSDTTYATLDFGDYLSLVLLDTGSHLSRSGRADRLAGRRSGPSGRTGRTCSPSTTFRPIRRTARRMGFRSRPA